MARSAPAHCGTCGFYLPLAGSLRAVFGTCGNEISPADGHVVHAEYGCGAHSEAEVEQVSPVLVADLIYDDALLDVEPLEVVDEIPAPAAFEAEDQTTVVEPAPAEAEPAPEPFESEAPEPVELTPESESPVESEPAAAESVSSAPEPLQDPTAVVMESVAAVEAPSTPPAPATEIPSAEIPPEASVGLSPAPVAEGISSPPAEVGPPMTARQRRRGFPVKPSVNDSIPSPLRPQMELPKGLGPRRLPRLSIRVPRALIRRKDSGPAENE
jgi:hypothetical protein